MRYTSIVGINHLTKVSSGSVPTAPTIGTATATGTTTATVTYTVSSSNGGSPITSYSIISTPSGGTGIDTTASGTISVTGLTSGTSYTFTVHATNAVGNSPNSGSSNSVEAWTTPGTPALTVTTNAYGATFSVTAPASNGGTAITSYNVVFMGTGPTQNLPPSINYGSVTTGSTYTAFALPRGSTWYAYAYCTNAVGNSPNSANSSWTQSTSGTCYVAGSNGNGQLGTGQVTSTNLSNMAVTGTSSSIKQVASAAQWPTGYQVRTDGSLWATGGGGDYMLGVSSSVNVSSWTRIGTSTAWTWAIAGSGAGAVMGAFQGFGLYMWGLNSSGQLGQNNTTTYSTPVQVAGSWIAAATGSAHVIGIKSDGTLWGWGNNSGGALGDGTTTNRSTPVQIATSATTGYSWIYVAAGIGASYAIRSDSTLWAVGTNTNGCLGIGNTTNQSNWVQVGSNSNWVSICSNQTSVLAINNLQLYGWGINSFGQLGTNNSTTYSTPAASTNTSHWVAIGCTYTGSSVGVQTNGTLWGWGSNGNGEITGTSQPATPLQIGTGTTWTNVQGGGTCSYFHA